MQKSYLSLWAGSYISSCPECSSSPRKCWDTSFCPFVQLHLIVNQIKFNGGDNYFFPVTVFFFLISLLPNGLSIFSSHMSRGLKNSSSNCSQVNTSAIGYFQAFYDTPQLIKSISGDVNQGRFFLSSTLQLHIWKLSTNRRKCSYPFMTSEASFFADFICTSGVCLAGQTDVPILGLAHRQSLYPRSGHFQVVDRLRKQHRLSLLCIIYSWRHRVIV